MDKREKNEFENGYGIASFVLAVFSFIFIIPMLLLTPFISIAGIVFAVMQSKKGKTGLGKAGLILSIISLVIAIIILAYEFLIVKLLG